MLKIFKTLSAFMFAGMVSLAAVPVGCCNDGFALSTNKKEYFAGEEVYVSARGGEDSWVGIYLEKDDIAKVEPIRWFYVAKNGYQPGQIYGLQHSAPYTTRDGGILRNLPGIGKYKVVLLKNKDDNLKVAKTVKINIVPEKLEKPAAPISLEYNLDNATDGLADGTLKIVFQKNSTAQEVHLFWADNQQILTEYTGLAPFKVTEEVTTFRMYDNTLIPSNATRLLAFGVNNAGTSDGYAEAVLPQGCQYNFAGKVTNEFQVVSDVHISIEKHELADSSSTFEQQRLLHDKHFLDMCNDIVKTSPNSQGIFVVGDIANYGRTYEWNQMFNLANSVENLPQLYFSLGNHDLYGSESYEMQVKTFFKYAQTDCVYYEREIAGISHIFLGTESKKSGVDADLSENQLAWFEATLQRVTTAKPEKPVFVYLHQSLYDTIAGSFAGQGWDGIMQEDRFREILKKYPQIYMFNGHSHWDMNTKGTMHAQTDSLPNIFNTASVAYLWDSFYVPQGEYKLGSQGFYIKVYEDKVLVLGRDFANGKWISSACFEAKFSK